MPVRAVDDKPSDTLVVVSGYGFWTGSSTLPHLHQRTHRRAVPKRSSVDPLERDDRDDPPGLLRVLGEFRASLDVAIPEAPAFGVVDHGSSSL